MPHETAAALPGWAAAPRAATRAPPLPLLRQLSFRCMVGLSRRPAAQGGLASCAGLRTEHFTPQPWADATESRAEHWLLRRLASSARRRAQRLPSKVAVRLSGASLEIMISHRPCRIRRHLGRPRRWRPPSHLHRSAPGPWAACGQPNKGPGARGSAAPPSATSPCTCGGPRGLGNRIPLGCSGVFARFCDHPPRPL